MGHKCVALNLMNFFALCLKKTTSYHLAQTLAGCQVARLQVTSSCCNFQEGIWLPTCHMNLYELFALKRIDRHDERVKSTARLGILYFVLWGVWSMDGIHTGSCLHLGQIMEYLGKWQVARGMGYGYVSRFGSLLICQARHVNAANYFALLLRCKIENSTGSGRVVNLATC